MYNYFFYIVYSYYSLEKPGYARILALIITAFAVLFNCLLDLTIIRILYKKDLAVSDLMISIFTKWPIVIMFGISLLVLAMVYRKKKIEKLSVKYREKHTPITRNDLLNISLILTAPLILAYIIAAVFK
jgi:hypothetical protein